MNELSLPIIRASNWDSGLGYQVGTMVSPMYLRGEGKGGEIIGSPCEKDSTHQAGSGDEEARHKPRQAGHLWKLEKIFPESPLFRISKRNTASTISAFGLENLKTDI